ncbi:4Fe-4S cluster-binding domain-containing protein [Clostridium saudiense]|uniref:4Fe-4S cluster-binding domain-containing protein n=1 Tax=Clostridium saudiense TaxID=1414720 RepID=UPI003266BCC9
MDFTIWVTRRCNLSCKYCYEGNNKLAASMDIKTADKTIEFICKTIKKVDENINVIFHGGEPLLEYGAVSD